MQDLHQLQDVTHLLDIQAGGNTASDALEHEGHTGKPGDVTCHVPDLIC